MNLKGKVFKCPDNVDTDVIIPAKYLNSSDEEYLGQHCLEPLDENFCKKISKGDIIVAGKNFGCGSSREHAPVAIKASGISCVIAESFARIFFRNAINIGLPVVELKDASKLFDAGDEVEINLSNGIIKNLTKNKEYKIQPFPEFLQKIISANGLVNFARENLL
ncbi:MAG: 3-isopropylmalate dehydratase small subunit [Endomicrobiia bacterium]